MARTGLSVLLCACMFLGVWPTTLCSPPPARAGTGDDKESIIAAALTVQTALQQGKDLLVRGNYQAAVHVLEGQLARINGNREYLAVLRDAYRGYVRELRLASQEAQAEVYFKRLLILDPGAILDAPKTGSANPPNEQPRPSSAAPKPPVEQPKPTAIRGKIEDDPFRQDNSKPHKEARTLLERAEQEFANRHYDVAGRLFDQAHQLDRVVVAGCGDRWAYCKLYGVVQQLNQPPASGPSYPDLEREVRLALSLAPRLDNFGKDLLRRIDERRSGPAARASCSEEASPSAVVRHLERTGDGWSVAESANFRILHNQPRELVERTAQVAEWTRTQMYHKWFGETGDNWGSKCELFLHATTQDYSRATGVPCNSPGHSTIRSEGPRVLARRIDLHCDDPNMLVAVLPHETTHVVLAGKFGDQPIPRWADEGMAVLTEPRDKIDRHLRNLPQFRQDRQMFYVRDLIQLNDYPHPSRIGAFYAQSVSLVDFLTKEKGPQTFTQFLREGLRGGYEAALQRHYGYQDFNELERRWRGHAFGEGATQPGIAERPH